jgi:Flp pilus assembly pilin Flp
MVADNILKSSQKNQIGASLVEYVLLAVLVAVVSIAAIKIFGENVSGMLSESTSSIVAG